MTNDDLEFLVNRWQTYKCILSRNSVVKGCKDILYNLAYKYEYNNNVEDLAQEGAIAIIEACNHFNPNKGMAFIPFVQTRIRYKIYAYIQNDRLIPNKSHNRKLKPPTINYFAEEPLDVMSSVEDNVFSIKAKEELNYALSRLKPRYQEALYRFYKKEESSVVIAKDWGCTLQAVQSLIDRARIKLRGLL